MLATGCSKNDDPDNGGYIKPDQVVADPTGTVELTMRNENNGRTWLGDLYINKSDNFTVSGGQIASIGQVNGLGNVSSIPTAGWAPAVAVIPGNGYVVYDGNNDEFYRVYVTSYIHSTAGGVMGANVKYQRPFKGLDESIRVKENKVILPLEGGSQQIVFENSSIIPFKVTSSEEWCKVKKASTRDQSFLADAIVISCDESFATNESKATVTIENLYGKEKTIEVTRPGRGEFITLSEERIYIVNDFESTYTATVNVFTNIDPTDITISSSEEWLSGEFSGAAYSPKRSVRWIENEPATRASLENPVSKALRVSVQGRYAGGEDREGTLTLSHGDTKCVLKVIQQGSNIKFTQTDFIFDAEENLTQTVDFSGYTDARPLKTSVDAENANWINVQIFNNFLTITLQPNPYLESRSGSISVTLSDVLVTKLNVLQKGAVITDKYLYFESDASNYTLSFPVKPGAKITSSADWCSATPNGASLVIRASATTEDRGAIISMEGIDAKIYVSQSKYKVGATYPIGDINATVYSMENGVGKIKYLLPQTEGYQWSTENIKISGLGWNDGSKNMDIIKAIPGWEDLYPAFAAVDALNKDGVTGWYLPAKNEYYGSYQNGNYGYWSSTQADSSSAYQTSGNSPISKSASRRIVAMNTFSYDFFKKDSRKR